jgi:hypothetical protein
LYKRNILQSDDKGQSWQIAFPQKGNYIDYIIDSQDRLVITGDKIDSANYVYIKDLKTNKIDSLTVVTERNLLFSRPREYKDGKYFIKANDQFNTYLFLLDTKDTSLTQLIPRAESNDSLDIKINRELITFQDYIYYDKTGKVLISTLNNMYETYDLFKTMNHLFYDKYQFSIYKQIELNNGSFLYSHYVFDSTLQEKYVLALYGYDEINNTQKTYLTHYLKEYNAINPISLMACSNDDYIVCRMGCGSNSWGYKDFINKDSIMISDDRGETFSFVPLPIPEGNYDYNYYAYMSPSVTKDGEIFLIINQKISEDKDLPSNFLADVYYGVPEDVGVAEFVSENNFLYPNPATDNITIDLSSTTINGGIDGDLSFLQKQESVHILDVLGVKVMSVETGLRPVSTQIDISTLQPGVYFLRIGNKKPQKFVKM